MLARVSCQESLDQALQERGSRVVVENGLEAILLEVDRREFSENFWSDHLGQVVQKNSQDVVRFGECTSRLILAG